VNELVAVDVPASRFLPVLKTAWDAGDAVFPVDSRYPPPARQRLFDAIRPTRLVTVDGITALDGQPVEDGDALVIATSGSTGEPKGVVLTHDALRAASELSTAALELGRDNCWLACLPLAHIGGFGVVSRALIAGQRLVIHDGFDAAAVEAAAAAGATAVSLVPTALRRINPKLFRVILLGGARPPADRPSNSVTTYGMTETCGGVVYNERPLDTVEVMIADDEILVRSPTLMRCYRAATTQSLDAPIIDGWLHTADMIISGGENIWPDAVEAALATHPAVADVAVGASPDVEWGQRVVAFVVPVDRHQPPTLRVLKDHCRETLPSFASPRSLHLVDSIPRTALGKVRRADLFAATERGERRMPRR
jgi:o-succinylbenzoate---CoA ligase